MLDKKVTRKDFLLTALSITAVFIGGKIPTDIKNKFSLLKKESNNSYGNSSYGGKKNA